MKLFNSLTRQIEAFEPFKPPHVGVYTCGPTVYSFVTIGNWRTYFLGDILVRTLKYLGFEVTYIMNITDVGHLTGDNLGDADTGDDRLEKAARKEQKTAWDVAKLYTDDFLEGYTRLNLTQPARFTKATDHITEQIDMVKKIEKKGFTYRTSDGVYFDTIAWESAGHEYGQLSTIDQVKEGARVEPNPEKKDPRDFALWKFSYPNGRDFDPTLDKPQERRAMEWVSPWGLGFPGWHIECSAMSTKYLGCQFDLHIGGEDLRSTHHPNEIVQAEAATGCVPFVKFWLHGAFLQVDGGRMGKSLGNAYTLQDIKSRGYKPEHLRYLYLTGHYRQPLNFTWENLEAAKQAYERLVSRMGEWKKVSGNNDKVVQDSVYAEEFKTLLEHDLQMPQVLALIWEMVKADIPPEDKYNLLVEWDTVLGLGLDTAADWKSQTQEYVGEKSGTKIMADVALTPEVLQIIDDRQIARQEKDWILADKLRDALRAQGFVVEDTKEGLVVRSS